MSSNAEGGGGGGGGEASSASKFCSRHPEVKVRRKDGFFKTTHIGCYKCKLGKVWEAEGEEGEEDRALAALNASVALTKGKDRRQHALQEIMEAMNAKQEDTLKQHAQLKNKVEELLRENKEVGAKWLSAATSLAELEKTHEHSTQQMDRLMESLDEAEARLKEAEGRHSVLEGQVALLHGEREALRTEALDYAQHITQLEAQLKALIEQQRLQHVMVPPSPVRATAPSLLLSLNPPPAPAPLSPRSKPSPLLAPSPSPSDPSPSHEPLDPNNKTPAKRTGSITLPTLFGLATMKHKAPPPNPTPAPAVVGGREKISVVAHMNNSERVNFKMYKDDPFSKVMDKYLKVKKIAAPMDEVKFTWGPHTLAPELTPDDVQLEEGAHINVIVPSEYLPTPRDEEEEDEEGDDSGMGQHQHSSARPHKQHSDDALASPAPMAAK